MIGLRDPGEGDWNRLRTLQYAELHKVSLIRIGAHGLAAIMAVTLYKESVAHWVLLSLIHI